MIAIQHTDYLDLLPCISILCVIPSFQSLFQPTTIFYLFHNFFHYAIFKFTHSISIFQFHIIIIIMAFIIYEFYSLLVILSVSKLLNPILLFEIIMVKLMNIHQQHPPKLDYHSMILLNQHDPLILYLIVIVIQPLKYLSIQFDSFFSYQLILENNISNPPSQKP